MILAAKLQEVAAAHGGELPMPVGPAAGALNELNPDAIYDQASRILLRSPAAYVTLGSATRAGGEGNAVIYRDPDTGTLAEAFAFSPQTGQAINSMNLPGPPFAEYLDVASSVQNVANDTGKLVIMSVSSRGGEDPLAVTGELVESALESGIHIVEANLACPNKGKGHPITALDADATGAALTNIVERVGQGNAVGVKLSYYERFLDVHDILDYHLLIQICRLIGNIPGIDFVTLTNTEPNQTLLLSDGRMALPRIPGNAGGGSGWARAQEAYQQLLVARRELPQHIDVISTTGVFDGAEALRRERAGAVLSGMVTRLWHGASQGDDYVRTLRKVHQEYIAARQAELDA